MPVELRKLGLKNLAAAFSYCLRYWFLEPSHQSVRMQPVEGHAQRVTWMGNRATDSQPQLNT